jgi:anti-sigma-K factor RskA
MDCDRLRGLLIEHVDGLLGREDAEAARAHLAACADCRRLQEEVRRNFASLDAWDEEDLPAGAFERVLGRLPAGQVRGGNGPAPSRPLWRVLAFPVAAGIAAAAAALWLTASPRTGAAARPKSGPAATTPAPDAQPVASNDLRPGERPLVFVDYDANVLREVRLPAGVDPASIQLISDEAAPIPTRGGVR